MHPTDDELRRLRTPSEDHFTERKTTGDSKDLLKTVVAFANSTPLDRFAVLFIGIRDDGTVEKNVRPESEQNKLAKITADVYPPIEYTTRALTDEDGDYLAVIVPGSKERPHFSGASYVRLGARTVKASDKQFHRLIAERNSKAYPILQNLAQKIEVRKVRTHRAEMLGRVQHRSAMQILDCTQFAVILRDEHGNNNQISLDRVDVFEAGGTISLEIRD